MKKNLKIKIQEVRNKSISVKFTENENDRVQKLADNRGMKKSTRIRELVKIGFNQATRRIL